MTDENPSLHWGHGGGRDEVQGGQQAAGSEAVTVTCQLLCLEFDGSGVDPAVLSLPRAVASPV